MRPAGPPPFPFPLGRGRAGRGFTLFELVVCILVFSVLVTVLLHRLAYYQELAEKAAMEATARILKTGLQIRLAQLIVANRQAEAGVLETADPTQWLERRPVNYGGTYHGDAQPGTWYFDEQARQLVYCVNTGSRLELDSQTGPKQVRYRVRLLKDRISLAGGKVESVTGVTLTAVTPYYWP
jgi:prepilin-type N-terminal cleavage/methylation domain-containing protein